MSSGGHGGMDPPEEQSQSQSRASKRRRVGKACLHCQRSHLMCDSLRPCSRCVKRNISHLCRDDAAPDASSATPEAEVPFIQWEAGAGAAGAAALLEAAAACARASGVVPSAGDEENATWLGELSKFPEFMDLGLFGLANGMAAAGGAAAGGPSGGGFPAGVLLSRGDVALPGDAASYAAQIEPGTIGNMARRRGVGPRIFDYVASFMDIRAYFAACLTVDQLMHLRDILMPVRKQILETLFNLEYKDLVFIEEMFERKVLFYKKYFDDIGVPSCLWRRTGHVELINDTFAELLGQTADELVGNNIYKMLDPLSLHDFVMRLSIPLLYGMANRTIISTMRFRRKNGAPFTVKAALTVKRDVYELPLCIVGSFMEITEADAQSTLDVLRQGKESSSPAADGAAV